jgi:hypothetical protein
VAALLLAGCGGSPRPKTAAVAVSPIGAWLAIVPGGDPYPAGCASDAPLVLDADGRYFTYGDVGEWTLRGDRLTFLTTEPSEVFPDVRQGDRRSERVRWIGRDEMWLTGPAGSAVRYRRCSPR